MAKQYERDINLTTKSREKRTACQPIPKQPRKQKGPPLKIQREQFRFPLDSLINTIDTRLIR